jgi:acetyl esterase/lipase
MRHPSFLLHAGFCLAVLFAGDFAYGGVAPSLVVPVWPEGKMPGTGGPGEGKLSENGKGAGIGIVVRPELQIFRAPGEGLSPACVVCPGGGYNHLAFEKEGTEIAAWLQSLGITAAVLEYRVPDNRDGAWQDIQRAVRLVRAHANEWGIDPKRVGTIGFSAGGHLSVRLATHPGQDAYPVIDEVDAFSYRPDYAVLVYPAYLDQKGAVSPDLPVTSALPPTFIVHNEDDLAYVGGSKAYHAALDAAGVPNEFALYQGGGHGYGLRSDKDVKVWPERCKDWLRRTGILPAS